MFNRVVTLCLVALAVALFTGLPLLAADKTDARQHEVSIVKFDNGKLTVLGSDGKEHTHALAKDAKISCNGKTCKASELKKGVKATVTVTGKGKAAQYTKVEAQTATTAKK